MELEIMLNERVQILTCFLSNVESRFKKKKRHESRRGTICEEDQWGMGDREGMQE
jgi:hypothetical protein